MHHSVCEVSYFMGFDLKESSHQVFERQRKLVGECVGTLEHQSVQFGQSVTWKGQFSSEQHVQAHAAIVEEIVEENKNGE